MATKVINLRNFARELGVDNQARIDRLFTAVVEGCMRSIPDLVQKSPVDTGLYAQSWRVEKTPTGAIIGNYSPHAAVIEFGARPFTPPIAPLLAWAKRVLQDPSQPGSYSDRVWALAKYTQAKIAREGMKPHNLLENAIPEILENIRKSYADAEHAES